MEKSKIVGWCKYPSGLYHVWIREDEQSESICESELDKLIKEENKKNEH